MDPKPTPVQSFLCSQEQYIVPAFQRGYQWFPELWHQLFLDLCQLTDTVTKKPDTLEM